MSQKYVVISHKSYKTETKLVYNYNRNFELIFALLIGTISSDQILISHGVQRRAVSLRQLSFFNFLVLLLL